MRADLLAGLTVALVLVPQSMAYAQLAGLPPYFGLYAAFLPVLIGALWGSSPQLATGPVAVVSLLTASSLAPLVAPGTAEYIAYAVLLALMVGVIQFALGVFRMGAIVNLLSHPVIVGFTNAAAIIIGLSQLSKLLGVPMSRSDSFLVDIAGVLQQAGDTHWPTFAMGLSALALMLLLRRFRPRWPNVLIAVALATVVSWQIGFERTLEVPLDAVRNEQARSLIADYLSQGASIGSQTTQLAQRRAALRTLRDSSTEPRIRIIALESEVELLRLQVEESVEERAPGDARCSNSISSQWTPRRAALRCFLSKRRRPPPSPMRGAGGFAMSASAVCGWPAAAKWWARFRPGCPIWLFRGWTGRH